MSMVVSSDTLSSSRLRNHCLKRDQELRNHATTQSLGVVAKELGNTPFSTLLPIFDETHYMGIENWIGQMLQDIFQQSEWERKAQIPFHPNSGGSEMDFHTVPVRQQTLMPTPGPSENMSFLCVADEYRECCGISGAYAVMSNYSKLSCCHRRLTPRCNCDKQMSCKSRNLGMVAIASCAVLDRSLFQFVNLHSAKQPINWHT